MTRRIFIESPYTFTEKTHPAAYLCELFVSFGDSVAIIDEQQNSTVAYNQLLSLWAAYQELLKTFQLPDGSRIAIHCHKDVHYIAAFLAALSLDYTIVPLLITHPEERKLQCLHDADVQLILGQPLPNAACTYQPFLEQVEKDSLPIMLSQYSQPAYCLFTSGSSGAPSGVLVPPDGLLSVIYTQVQTFSISSSSRTLWYYELSFDASLSDIFVPLFAGATLVIPEQKSIESPQSFYQLIERHSITHCDIPPSFLSLLDPEKLAFCLESIILGGEVCSEAVIDRHKERRLINVYGPTETTICSSLSIIEEHTRGTPLGAPVANMRYLLVPEQDSGLYELHIQGKGVAQGYLHTSQNQPFYHEDGLPTYASGDIVRYEEGNIYFHGRKDRQIQIHGHRVDLHEIERALRKLFPAMQHALTVHTHSTRGTHIVAHLCAKKPQPASSIITQMQTCLPLYACPKQVHYYKQFPVNLNGKLDYQALYKIAEKQFVNDKRTLSDYLLLASKDPQATIFELGLNSLEALSLLSELRDGGYFVSLNDLYSLPLLRLLEAPNGQKGMYLSFSDMKRNLAADWTPLSQLPDRKEAIRSVFLTGATGFLGSRILRLLIEVGVHVHCLIRSNNQVHAKMRLNSLHCTEHTHLLTAYSGDCHIPNFGLSDEDYDMLVSSIDGIIHCASDVSVLQDVTSSSVQRTVTVQNLIHLATSSKAILYSISTLALFVDSDHIPERISEQSCIHDAGGLFGGYNQHKFLEETYLRHEASLADIPIAVIRPGLLLCDEQCSSPPRHDHVYRALTFLMLSGCYPAYALQQRCDATPVSLAASIIVQKILSGARAPLLHIANPETLSLETIVSFMNNNGYNLSPCSIADWQRVLSSAATPVPQLFCRSLGEEYYAHMRAFDLFMSTGTQFVPGRELTYLLELLHSGFPEPIACLDAYVPHLSRLSSSISSWSPDDKRT